MTTGRTALFFGPGRDMEITELPVPDPEPGATVARITRAHVCGRPGRGTGDARLVGDDVIDLVTA